MKAVWAVVVAVLGCGVARADAVFDFTIIGSAGARDVPFATVGKFLAVDEGRYTNNYGGPSGEQYLVVGASGETGGVPITGVVPAGTPYIGGDNMLYVSDGFTDFRGFVYPPATSFGFPGEVGFTLADGTDVLVSLGWTGYYINASPASLGWVGPIGFTISLPEQTAATPEPGTMGLVGTGVLGVVGMVRRRVRG